MATAPGVVKRAVGEVKGLLFSGEHDTGDYGARVAEGSGRMQALVFLIP